ncbi:MAG: hypothetical protein KI791_19660 [Cyclobacteriaceae bacterium]|nr:hypothetical protein [Cyclobacteriaceae bacterium SS2]
MNERYLKYEITTRKAGLKHQAYNLKTLIFESDALGRIPVISKWHLFGYHNFKKGIDTDFTKYFDFTKVQINDKHVKVLLEKDLKPPKSSHEYLPGEFISPEAEMAIRKFPVNEGGSWKYVKVLQDRYQEINLSIKIPYSKSVLDLADKLFHEIGDPMTVVHVRRRDVMKKNWRLLWDTKPKNILRKLIEVDSTRNVYIMSNEPRSSFFDSLKAHYNLTTIADYDWLKQIQKEDNFLAFCIELQLLKMATKKITTFSNNTDEDWDGYLSKAKF